MKIKNLNQTITVASFTSPIHNRFFDAVVVHTPNLSLYLKMQNLISFFLDCLKDFLRSTEPSRVDIDNINRCIQHIEHLYKEYDLEFDFEIKNTFGEFFDEITIYKNLLKVFLNNEKSSSNSESTGVLLAAKSSRLQWLSICILEELKQIFSICT